MGGRRTTRAAWTRALAIGTALAVAGAPVAANAATSAAEVTITGGSLSLNAGDFQAQSAALTGAEQVLSTTPAAPWSAIDARGTGASWTVVASASDLVSVGAPNRTIPSSALALTTGAITAGTGADAITGMTGATAAAFAVPSGPGQTDVSVLAAPGPHRGAFSFTPRLDITIPASALASHVGSPYTTTLTVTIS